MTYDVIKYHVMTYDVITWYDMTYDFMTYDVMTYDVMTYDIANYRPIIGLEIISDTESTYCQALLYEQRLQKLATTGL